jgi:Ca2+-transporting ATPase
LNTVKSARTKKLNNIDAVVDTEAAGINASESSRHGIHWHRPGHRHEIPPLHKGLSEKEAERKLAEHGPNLLSEKKRISALGILLRQFSDYMVLILMACTAISAFMGESTEALTIIAIVVLNSTLGFIQEFRTERTLEALKGLSAPLARVIRDGKKQEILAEDVVPGDIVMLEAGDRVPADAVVVEESMLQVDESLLTGESAAVEKERIHTGMPCLKGYEGRNTVFLGTTVLNGRAKASVFATGMNTEMGKIADMIQNADDEETPLQKRLSNLGKLIAVGCLLICAVVSLTGILRGEDLFNMLLAGISLAVAAVPEGLPAIVTVSLALGVRRMLKRNALIRRLPAVETLGSANIICSDKTGTLTENRMTVRRIYNGDRFFEPDKAKKEAGFMRLVLEIGAVCNNAVLNGRSGDGMQGSGDPTEVALLIAAAKQGITPESLERAYKRIHEIPFDSDRKCMSVVCTGRGSENLVFTKGAPDIIINKCSRIETPEGIKDITPAMRRRLLEANDTMAGDALRVLAMAYKKLPSSWKNNDRNLESGLVFAGMAGIMDPPRKEAFDAVRKCRMAGIRPVMITGDHRLTAAAVAKELGILQDGDLVVTGSELDAMDNAELDRISGKISVFARVSPGHKLRIVKALKNKGNIVAMTGDGVNDAPAVKEADIGVAMGISGTDVTKEASAMVLLDDNFATIVAAVEEGRVIYSNIRKFIRYMLACNIGEVLTMFLGMLMGLPVPLLPIQILWVNLVTDGLPAIALGFDPPEKDIMLRPPARNNNRIFSNGLLSLILTRGTLIGISTLAVFGSIMYMTGETETARTGAFVTLVITQLIHVFECKSERKSLLHIPVLNNKLLIIAVLCSLVMLLGVVYIPVFQGIFKTVSLNAEHWSAIAVFCIFGPVAAGLSNARKRHHRKM